MAERNVVVKLSANTTAFSRGMRTGSTLLRGFGRTANNVRKRVFSLTGAVVGLAGGAGLLAIANSARNNIDSLAKLSTNLGTTVSETQKLKLVSELSGVSLETSAKAMQRFSQVVGEAGRGFKRQKDTLDALGLSADELGKLTPLEQFQAATEALGKVEDRALRASLANDIFGRAWKTLTPLIESGAAGFARADAVIDGMGLALSQDASKGVERLSDNMTVLGTVVEGLKDQTFAALTPDLDKLVVDSGRFLEQWIKSNGGAEQLAQTIRKSVLTALTEVDIILGGIGAALDAIGAELSKPAQAAGKLAATVGELAEGNLSGALAIAREGRRGGAAGGQAALDEAAERQLRATEETNKILRGGWVAVAG